MKILSKNEKGFIFTLDAVFALVVASVGISILLYASFTNTAAYGYPVEQAFNLLHNLIQAPQISNGTAYSSYLEYVQNTSIYTWPQFAHDGQLSSASGYGPKTPMLLYSFVASNAILPAVSVAEGDAAFSAGSNVYVLNAGTGKQVFTFTSKSAIAKPPLIYEGSFYYANATNSIGDVSLANANQIWSLSAVNGIYSQLSIINGYLTYGTENSFYIINPFNGSIAAYAITNSPTQTPAYTNGEYIISTSSASGQNYLYSYALTGNSLVNIWSAALSSTQTTAPTILNNTVGIGSGTTFYIFSLGGGKILQSSVGSQVTGIAALNNVYYVETYGGIYGFTSSGSSIFYTKTVTDSQNSTPSYSGSILYTLVNGDLFQGYSTSQYKQLWNITMPSNYFKPNYSDIALAYGNAYVPNNNILYVFGSYKSQESDSLLHIISNMYLNDQGDSATALLNNLYNSSDAGIFINNTYAPTLDVATFNSLKSSYIEQANGFPWMNNLNPHFTISVWVNSTSNNGVIIDELGQQAPATGWHESLLNLASGVLYLRAGSLCVPYIVNFPTKVWNNIVLTYSDATYTIYINGESGGSFPTNIIVPGGSDSMRYPLGLGDAASCGGSGAYFNGSMLDYQIYNTSLTATQIGQLYQGGAIGPAKTQNPQTLQLWLPLDGNPNDFSGLSNIGFPSNIVYAYNPYTPTSLSDSYQVSKAGVPIYLTSNNVNKLYNVSVVVWK